MNIFVTVAALAACFVAVSAIPMDYGEDSVMDVHVVVAAYAGVDKVMITSEAKAMKEFYKLPGEIADYEGDMQDVVVVVRALILKDPSLAIKITSPHLIVLGYVDRNGDREINYKVKKEAEAFTAVTKIPAENLVTWDTNEDGSISIEELNAQKGKNFSANFLTGAKAAILLIEFDTDMNMKLAGSEVSRFRQVLSLNDADAYKKIDALENGIDFGEMYDAIAKNLIKHVNVLVPAILVIRVSDKDHSGGVNSDAEIKFAATTIGEVSATIKGADIDGDSNISGIELAAAAVAELKVCKPNGSYEAAKNVAGLTEKLEKIGNIVAAAA